MWVGALRAPENLADDAQHVDRRQEGANHAGEQPPGMRRAPGPDKREELRDEPGGCGQAERREPADRERRRDPGHHLAEAPHREDGPRVRLLIDQADQREEEAGHDPVRNHLEHRAVQPLFGQRRDAEHDDAHVRDGGIRDDVFQIGLRHGAQGAVHDVDAGDGADEPGPLDRAAGDEAEPQTQDAVGAELHQHAGVKHRHGGGGRRMAVRRPGVERPDAGENPEADVEREEHPRLESRRELRLLQVDERNALRAGRGVARQDAHQDERRPEQQVECQLHRGVFLRADAGPLERPPEDALRPHLPARTPDADEQVHRQDGDLVEEEEDEEVQRHEHAEHAGDQEEQQRVELLAARLDRPRREHAREQDDGGQQHEHEAHAVDRDGVSDAEGRHQRMRLAELEAGRRAIVRKIQPDREHERDGRPGGRGPSHEQRPVPRPRHDHERGGKRRPRDDRKDRHPRHQPAPIHAISANNPNPTANT